MTISSPTRTALGDPTQLWPPDPAAGFTMMALAGSGGAIGMGPSCPVAAGVVSSWWVTHQEYAMRHDSNPTCVLRHLHDLGALRRSLLSASSAQPVRVEDLDQLAFAFLIIAQRAQIRIERGVRAEAVV